MRADDMKTGDAFIANMACRVISAKSVDAKNVRVRVAIEDMPSLSLSYGAEVEFTCRKGREFGVDPRKRPGGRGYDPCAPTPVSPTLEPVEG
jgi:hypothetical protein